MGINKSKNRPPNTRKGNQLLGTNILVFGSFRSGKTLFLKSIASQLCLQIYVEELEVLIDFYCRNSIATIAGEMNQQQKEETFRNQPNDSGLMSGMKKMIISDKPHTLTDNLKQFSNDLKVFAQLWNETNMIEFVSIRNYSNNFLDYAWNYDQFFKLVANGVVSKDVLKYLTFTSRKIIDLKICIGNENYTMVDARNMLSRGGDRMRKWEELNENAQFGIFMASLVDFDLLAHNMMGNDIIFDMDDSLEIFKEVLINRSTQQLRIIVLFTKADLLIEKLSRTRYNREITYNERKELRRIGSKNGERQVINSIIDLYQQLFESLRPMGTFEYHIINTLSDSECYECLLESRKQLNDPTRKIIISKSLTIELLGNLFKMIGQHILSDISIITYGSE